MRKKMRSTRLNLGFLVLAAASCDFTRLPALVDGATSDGGSLPFGLELLAGDIGSPGYMDGTGADARFQLPIGVAVDNSGNVYVADPMNYTIRKITPAGVVTTPAGTAGMYGSTDGAGADALFSGPTGVAVDNSGNVYVSDTTTIRKVTADGVVTTLAGTVNMRGSADGIGAAARFNAPWNEAVDSAGNIYVADSVNFTIRKITPGGVVTTLAGNPLHNGSADGSGAAARFRLPSGVAVDSAGNVYVADTGNSTIRKVTADGVVTTLAGTAQMSGSADGTGAGARFRGPIGVAVDSAGNVYVADTDNATIRKVTPTGVVTTIAGVAGMAGIVLGGTPRLLFPQSLAVDGDSLVISDANTILLLRHGAQ